MKKTRFLFLTVGLMAVCFAFATKVHSTQRPGVYSTEVLDCTITDLPPFCNAGTEICTDINPTNGYTDTYYKDAACTEPYFQP